MFVTGSYIVSKYAGSYTDFVAERIFEPLGMGSTTFFHSAAAQTGNLTQAWVQPLRRIPYWLTDETSELIAGAGGIISNVADLVGETQKVLMLRVLTTNRPNGSSYS